MSHPKPPSISGEYFDSKQTVYSVLFRAYYGDEYAYNIPNFPHVLYTYIYARATRSINNR